MEDQPRNKGKDRFANMSIITRIVQEVRSDLKQMAGLLQPPSRSRSFAQQRANQIRGIDDKNLTLRNRIRQNIGKACELYSKGFQIPIDIEAGQ